MSATAERAARVEPTTGGRDRPAGTKLLARRTRAIASHCIQDAADYFRLVRQALLGARQTVFILGWDITAHTDLLPGLRSRTTRRPGSTSCSRTSRGDVAALRCYILTWDYGVALHARARSVLAMAARVADAAQRPVRLRRSPSRRRLASSEDRRGRRSAGVLRRHRSDGPSLGHERAPAGGTGEGDADRQGLRSVSRGAGDGERPGGREPRRAGARSLACARRRAAAAGRRVRRRPLAVDRHTRPHRRRRRDRADDARLRNAAGRSANAKRCFSTRSPRRSGRSTSRASTSRTTS